MPARMHVGAAIALIVFPGLCAAQQPTQAQVSTIRQLCRGDYQAHCANVPPGGSASLACLQQNAASLSEPCQQALRAISTGAPATVPSQPAPRASVARPPMSRREEIALLRRSCAVDYRTFCNDIEPGGGRGLACLHAHGPELSSPCRSALAAARTAR